MKQYTVKVTKMAYEHMQEIVKNFLIYFWIDEHNMKVQVTGVIYGRRDQVVQLAKLDRE